jgi:hypothetical protein
VPLCSARTSAVHPVEVRLEVSFQAGDFLGAAFPGARAAGTFAAAAAGTFAVEVAAISVVAVATFVAGGVISVVEAATSAGDAEASIRVKCSRDLTPTAMA